MFSDARGHIVAVPKKHRHAIPAGLLRAIIAQAGLTPEQFAGLL